MDLYRATFPENSYKALLGTRMIHQVTTKPNCSKGIFSRNLSCACDACLSGNLEECFYHTIYNLEENLDLVYKWNVFGKNNNEVEDIDFTKNDDIDDTDDIFDFIETDAAKLIAVICSGDEVSQYYLLQLNCDPFVTDDVITDNYNHSLLPQHRVIKGHYLELFREQKYGFIYYLEKSKEAVISAFSVIGVCPDLDTVAIKRKGKMEEMYILDNDLHQSLCELANNDFF